MTYVHELRPGDLVDLTLRSATFVAQTAHPLYPGLQLVVWRLDDGSWSHDALSPQQYVGEARATTLAEAHERLRAALLGSPP